MLNLRCLIEISQAPRIIFIISLEVSSRRGFLNGLDNSDLTNGGIIVNVELRLESGGEGEH